MADGSVYSSAMKRCWFIFVNNVEPLNLVDYLYQSDLLTDNEIERLTLPTLTRHDRCRMLLRILRCRIVNCDEFQTLLDALESAKCSFVAERLRHFVKSLDITPEALQQDLVTDTMEDRGDIYPDISGTGGLYSKEETSCSKICKSSYCLQEVCGSTESLHCREQLPIGSVLVTNVASRPPPQNFICLKCSGSKDSAGYHSQYPSCQCSASSYISLDVNVTRLSADQTADSCLDRNEKLKYGKCDSNANLLLNVAANSVKTDIKLEQFCVSACAPDYICLPLLRRLPPSNKGHQFGSHFHRELLDSLGAMVNACNWTYFTSHVEELRPRLATDHDAACIVLYLEASRCLMKSEFGACKQAISQGLELSAFTQTPNRFTILMLSLKTWLLLKNGQHRGTLQSILDDAMQIICQDPLACSGMAAGWIYVDQAKYFMSQAILNSPQKNVERIHAILKRSQAAYRLALEHFTNDEGNDGPYGYNYTAVKLASALLACDDGLKLVDICGLCSEENIREAEDLLRTVDCSQAGVAEVLKPLHLAAEADLKYRLNIPRRAFELAQQARHSAQCLQLVEETRIADARCRCYAKQLESTVPTSTSWKTLPAQLSRSLFSRSHSSDAEAEESDTSLQNHINQVSQKKKRCKFKNAGLKRHDSSKTFCTHYLLYFIYFFVLLLVIFTTLFVYSCVPLTFSK